MELPVDRALNKADAQTGSSWNRRVWRGGRRKRSYPISSSKYNVVHKYRDSGSRVLVQPLIENILINQKGGGKGEKARSAQMLQWPSSLGVRIVFNKALLLLQGRVAVSTVLRGS